MHGYVQLWWAFVAFFLAKEINFFGIHLLLLQAKLTVGSGSRIRMLVGQEF